MRRYTYNWIWVGITAIITAVVAFICISDILKVINPEGLRIVSKVPDGDRIVYTLDCGATLLQFSAVDYTTLQPGDYVPAFDEFRDKMNSSIAVSCIFLGVVILFFISELLRVPDRILRHKAKQGTMINGEIKSFESYIPGFYIVKVDGNGTTYTMKYPLTKRECKKWGKGASAIVWNGGRKRQWVELQKPAESLSD